MGGGYATLLRSTNEGWTWELIAHPGNLCLPLQPQVIAVMWQKVLFVTRTSDPCWTRTLYSSPAVVAPFVLPSTAFTELVDDFRRLKQGRMIKGRACLQLMSMRRSHLLRKSA